MNVYEHLLKTNISIYIRYFRFKSICVCSHIKKSNKRGLHLIDERRTKVSPENHAAYGIDL